MLFKEPIQKVREGAKTPGVCFLLILHILKIFKYSYKEYKRVKS